MSSDDLVKLFTARARIRLRRGWKRKAHGFDFEAPQGAREALGGEKPAIVRTYLRNMIIVPEMIGSILGVYNGKEFTPIGIKPKMIGHLHG